MFRSRKKAFIALLIVLVAVLLLPHFFVLGGVSAVKEHRSHPSAMPYWLYFEVEALEDLESNSDYIVKGYVDYGSVAPVRRWDDISSTKSSLHITKTYKGELKEGDTIHLREPFYVTLEKNKYVTYYLGRYTPSEKDTEYIFFLSFNDGYYEPVALEKGRHKVSSEISEESYYKYIHDEVVKKYSN